MKLISLNMEGERHFERVTHFLTEQTADVVCLQEAPEHFQTWLQEAGYQTTYTPMMLREQEVGTTSEGLIFASSIPHTAQIEYYYKSAAEVVVHQYRNTDTCANAIILGSVIIEDQSYLIGTTHVMVTIDGKADDHQRHGVERLLSILGKVQPHILCGDFNMPREYNDLYQLFTNQYHDAIPATYTSSLDRSLHRLGNRTDLNAPIFDIYMVDYLFTKSPYEATDVRLQFGLSDHAAIVGTITQ